MRKAPDQKETKLDSSGLDEILEERPRQLENKPPPQSNKELQQAYRERHGEDLRKAHRLATALMSLHGHGRDYPEFTLKRVLDTISNFLTADEMKLFLQTAGANMVNTRKKKRKVKTPRGFSPTRFKQAWNTAYTSLASTMKSGAAKVKAVSHRGCPTLFCRLSSLSS